MPEALCEQITASNQQWIQAALSQPLEHAGVKIWLAPVCAWAPLGW